MTFNNAASDDNAWLRAALGGDGTGPDVDVLVRPDAASPELIIPLGSRAAAAATLHRYHDARSIKERAMTLAGESLARIGQLHRAPGTPTKIRSFALVEELAKEFGEPELLAAVTLGPRRRNRKPVLQLFRPDGATIGFAKVGWSVFTRELVANEAHWLQRVAGRLPPGLTAPTVLYNKVHGDRHVVVTSPLHTPITARRSGPLRTALVVGLARALGSERQEVQNLEPVLGWRGHQTAELIDLGVLLERHGATTVEVGLWHGDLTRWNTATTRAGTMLWDWEFAAGNRPVGLDLLHQEFERVRRDPAHDEQDAVEAVMANGPAWLEQLGQPANAVLDLYLCELIVREARLKGEGWDPANLGPLDTVAARTLRSRLL